MVGSRGSTQERPQRSVRDPENRMVRGHSRIPAFSGVLAALVRERSCLTTFDDILAVVDSRGSIAVHMVTSSSWDDGTAPNLAIQIPGDMIF